MKNQVSWIILSHSEHTSFSQCQCRHLWNEEAERDDLSKPCPVHPLCQKSRHLREEKDGRLLLTRWPLGAHHCQSHKGPWCTVHCKPFPALKHGVGEPKCPPEPSHAHLCIALLLCIAPKPPHFMLAVRGCRPWELHALDFSECSYSVKSLFPVPGHCPLPSSVTGLI